MTIDQEAKNLLQDKTCDNCVIHEKCAAYRYLREKYHTCEEWTGAEELMQGVINYMNSIKEKLEELKND